MLGEFCFFDLPYAMPITLKMTCSVWCENNYGYNANLRKLKPLRKEAKVSSTLIDYDHKFIEL